MRLLVFLATTYLAAQMVTAYFATGRVSVNLELACVAIAVVLAEWGALALTRRLLGRRGRA